MNQFIELIKALSPRDISSTLMTVFIIFMVWMYKELRTSFMENRKNDQQRIEKALETYTEAEIEMFKYIHNKSDFYLSVEKISKCLVLLSPRLVEMFNKLKEETNHIDQRAAIIMFRKELNNEITLLKSEQVNPIITSDSSGDILETIESFVKSKVAPFLLPVFHTYLTLAMVFVIFFFALSLLTAGSVLKGFTITFLFSNLCIYIIFQLSVISEGFIKKRFDYKGFNLLWYIIFCFTPGAFLFSRDWYIVLGIFVLSILYMNLFRKKALKRT